MPEVVMRVRWPDGSASSHYSPSLRITEVLDEGASYPVGEFVRIAVAALQVGSDRVEEKYGFPCSRAAASMAQIGGRAQGVRGDVVVEAFAR